MFAFVTGRVPIVRLRAGLARGAVLSIVLALAGCASAPHQYSVNEPATGPRVAQASSVDVEDDGLPAQTPPTIAKQAAPDDPSEPFSRNYGGPNPSSAEVTTPAAAATKRPPVPVIPDDLPPAFRRKLSVAMGQEE